MGLEMNSLLSTSSERFVKGVRWLESEVKFDEVKIRTKLEKCKSELKKMSREKFERMGLENKIRELDLKLRLMYRCYEVEEIYVLKKVNSGVTDEFLLVTGNEAFWKDDDTEECLYNDFHALWFLKESGLENNPYFLELIEYIIKSQSVEGYIQSSSHNHCGPLRVLVATRPESKALSNAVKYWLENWRTLSRYFIEDLVIGILALTELDFEKYSNVIEEQISYLKSVQNDDGSWGKEYSRFKDTSYVIWALSRVNSINDPYAQKGLEWLAQRQREDGSWEDHPDFTAKALLAFLAMGEGPKVPLELMDYQFMRLNQSFKRQKPVFLHTSPLYQGSLHVKEIHSKIVDMLPNAKKEIRIASPFIDMLYEEIINLTQENPDLTIKVVTKPKKDVKGTRERIAKNVIDLLDIATKGNVVQSDLVHSRMIIVDEEELLLSSADLTRDQLYDEFNAGIWTSDKETVKKAIEFFDNLFELEKQKP